MIQLLLTKIIQILLGLQIQVEIQQLLTKIIPILLGLQIQQEIQVPPTKTTQTLLGLQIPLEILDLQTLHLMVQVETLILLETQIHREQQPIQIIQDLQTVQIQVGVQLTQIIQGLQTLHLMEQVEQQDLQTLQTLLETLILLGVQVEIPTLLEAQVGQQVITPRLQT